MAMCETPHMTMKRRNIRATALDNDKDMDWAQIPISRGMPK